MRDHSFPFKTIRKSVACAGVGIHLGKLVRMVFQPAEPSSGIMFYRSDLKQELKVHPSFMKSQSRATILEDGALRIVTPEHLLASCFGLGITDLVIELDGDEIPIMDGSALPFCQLFLEAGLVESKFSAESLILQNSAMVKQDAAYVLALPDAAFKLSFVIEYPQSFIGVQTFSLEITPESFLKEIAPARTYGFFKEYEPLLKKGLAMGVSLDNTVIIDEDGYRTELRFGDELVRHKILDLLGDLAIMGKPILGHVLGFKSGHTLNAQLIREIF